MYSPIWEIINEGDSQITPGLQDFRMIEPLAENKLCHCWRKWERLEIEQKRRDILDKSTGNSNQNLYY